MTPEGKVKARVDKILKPYVDAGKVYRFMPVPYGYGESSLDYILCVSGKFVSIETKAPGKKPTALQNNVIRRMVGAGGKVFVLSSVDECQVFADWLGQELPGG